MATIKPLDGKYYGTYVLHKTTEIKVWYMGDRKPSQRQLDAWKMTIDEAMEDDMLCDDHYESREGAIIADTICHALTGLED